jgi:hypothetical protein
MTAPGEAPDQLRLAYARSQCCFSPLAQAIGERFLQAYIPEPGTGALTAVRRAFAREADRLLSVPEGSAEAREARRAMELHRDALRAFARR